MRYSVLLLIAGALLYAAESKPDAKPLPVDVQNEVLKLRLSIDNSRDALEAKAPQEWRMWVATQTAFQAKMQEVAKQYCPNGQITNDLTCMAVPAQTKK